ncbi:Sensor protein QseC [Vibrio aerogenes CECT 7868]|uniref:histidine kinase n=1 Tax=Vibrio aerogenes CECT 7868 TaxID=1216006 RepID=A0A1M5ZPS5_9VIBR|nr:HAMP domain-containing sensor histidine kinase [Vibrio aerogenes]SHI26158.1 Sensor protein QseC [Vibrio aerogenes CECT 7868]
MTGRKKSIQSRLMNLISLSLAVILSILFILIDVNMDDWAENQFTNEIQSQSYILKSIISVNHPEKMLITGNDILNAEQINNIYYQVWVNGRVVEKSPNMRHLPDINLIRQKIGLNTSAMDHVDLPDGERGVAIFSRFTVPGRAHTEYYLTVYNSEAKLNRVLYTIDTALIVSFILTLFLTRIVARHIVVKGLAPLSALNDEIIRTTAEPSRLLSLSEHDVEEISPIYQSVNRYISHNRDLMNNEKRITSDIAHELKTPISELITLTEVYEKFPDDPRIAATYSRDILTISSEMKSLVNGLLSLQQIDSQTSSDNTDVALRPLLTMLMQKQNITRDDLRIKMSFEGKQNASLFTDKTALSVILRNLLDNALYYRQQHTRPCVDIRSYPHGTYLIVSNKSQHQYNQATLDNLTNPLFKFDTSRKNDKHYGLGLTIVKRLCEKHGYSLFVRQDNDMNFSVIVMIPHPASLTEPLDR